MSHMSRELLEPKNLFCMSTAVNPYVSLEPSPVQVVKLDGNKAIVGIKKAIPEGFLIPGFWPARTRYEDRQLTLVLESERMESASPTLRSRDAHAHLLKSVRS